MVDPLPSSSLVLAIRKEPPRFVYWEEPFSVEVIISRKGKLKHARSSIQSSISKPPTKEEDDVEDDQVPFQISVALQCDPSDARSIEDGDVPTLSILRQDPSKLTHGVPGTLVCRIHASPEHRPPQERHYSVLITAVAPDQPILLQERTAPISLVRYKLRLTAPDWHSVWYKDEGGRDKCMELTVGLYDAQQKMALGSWPLSVTLCYAVTHPTRTTAPIPVSNPEILRILSPKAPLRFSQSSETMKLRFRIEDVSKNHQGQDFCLQLAVAADDSVAPVTTPAVNVRSKRNKRPRWPSSGDPPVVEKVSLPKPDMAPLRDALGQVQHWVDEAIRAMIPWQPVSPAVAAVCASVPDAVRGPLQLLQLHLGGCDDKNDAMYHPPPRYPPYEVAPPTLQYLPKHPPFPYYPPHPAVGGAIDRRRAPHPPSHRTATTSPSRRHWKSTAVPGGHARPEAVESTCGGEEDVEYIYAQQFKSVRTGEWLGYPAYSRDEVLVGFYRASTSDPQSHHTFRAVPLEDFGPKELAQAQKVLRQAPPGAIQSRQQWGSVEHMIHRAMVYEWCQGIR